MNVIKALWGVVWRSVVLVAVTVACMLIGLLLTGCATCSYMECPPITDSVVIYLGQQPGVFEIPDSLFNLK